MAIDDIFYSNSIIYNFRVNIVKPCRWVYNKIFHIDSTLTRRTTYQIFDSYLENSSARVPVLDAGCGTGTFLKELTERYDQRLQLYGSDILKHFVKDLKHSSRNIDLCVCSINALPYKSNTFHVASTSWVYHHLQLAIHHQALTELKRVARKHVLIRDVCSEKTFLGKLFKLYWKIFDNGTKYRTQEEWHEFLCQENNYQDFRGSYPDWICSITL